MRRLNPLANFQEKLKKFLKNDCTQIHLVKVTDRGESNNLEAFWIALTKLKFSKYIPAEVDGPI